MSEIGVIGATYEDRRTKKKGKLLERDEKFKTLLMESSDGKSFNITFGGFKSNWRKVDEPVQTVEEAMVEAIPEEQITVKKQKKPAEKKPAEKKAPKKEAKTSDNSKEVSAGVEATVTALVDFVKTFSNDSIRFTVHKRSNIIVVNGRKLFEVLYGARKNRYQVCVREEQAVMFKKKSYAGDLMFHENWVSTKYAFFMDAEHLPEFLDDMRDVIITMLEEEE